VEMTQEQIELMVEQYQKPTILKYLKEEPFTYLVASHIKECEEELNLFRKIVNVLPELDGLELSTTFLAMIKNIFPEYTIYIDNSLENNYILSISDAENESLFLLAKKEIFYSHDFLNENTSMKLKEEKLDKKKNFRKAIYYFILQNNTILNQIVELSNDAALYEMSFMFDIFDNIIIER
jgi:hypothetical protein